MLLAGDRLGTAGTGTQRGYPGGAHLLIRHYTSIDLRNLPENGSSTPPYYSRTRLVVQGFRWYAPNTVLPGTGQTLSECDYSLYHGEYGKHGRDLGVQAVQKRRHSVRWERAREKCRQM